MLLAFGLGTGIAFETCARRLDLWRYADAMPALRIDRHYVGLVPVL